MNRMRLVAVMAFIVTGLFVAYALANAQAATAPVILRLEADNNSGQAGTATLTDVGGGKTLVEVEVTGEPDGASQPMQVHAGQCGPTLARLAYPLTNLEGGKSTTTIEVALSALTTGGYAINVHKSEEQYNIYVMCGNIPSDAAIMAQATGTGAAALAIQNATPDVLSPLTIGLQAENNSGQTGTVTMTDLGNGQTKIEIDVAGEPAGASQLMHLHAGQCGPTLARLIFPLTNLENGKSTTTIDAPLGSLTTGGYAINGHKSREEYNIYVMCGNIPAQGAIAQATPSGGAAAPATATAPAAAATETTIPPTTPTPTSTNGATTAPTAAPTEAATAAATATTAATLTTAATATTATTATIVPPTATTAVTATTAAAVTSAATSTPAATATSAATATTAATSTTAPTATTAPPTATSVPPTAAATATTAATSTTAPTATTAAPTATRVPPTAAATATTAATLTTAATATTAATTVPTRAATTAPAATTAAPTAALIATKEVTTATTAAATEAATTSATEAATAASTEAATEAATTSATEAATTAATKAATTAAGSATEVATTAATEAATKVATTAATETATVTATAVGPTPAPMPESGADPQTDRFPVIALLGALVLGIGITFLRYNPKQR